jgi:two-component system, chemotaxis family, protein-glutamate methylesterase/glutaminase
MNGERGWTNMPLVNRKIRVMVVDDSAVMRKMIPGLLARDDEIEVVATALDGDFAIMKIEQARPDVVTLDVDMPRMDGITALRHIAARYEIPVLMLSSFTTVGAALTLKALEMGAVDFVCKPSSPDRIGEMSAELIAKIKAAARSKVVELNYKQSPNLSAKPNGKWRSPFNPSKRLVAIGASSGGPNALRFMLPKIPGDFAAGIVIVQHMPEKFTEMLARWLDDICELEVKEARDGDLISPGRALMAPGNSHLRVKRTPLGPVAKLDREQPVNGHMPSVDVLFRSVAAEYKSSAVAIIMTGMGCDGAAGMGEIKQAGGITVAQDKDSCTIFGMPRAAIDRGSVDKIVPLNDMASYLVSAVGRSESLEGGVNDAGSNKAQRQ